MCVCVFTSRSLLVWEFPYSAHDFVCVCVCVVFLFTTKDWRFNASLAPLSLFFIVLRIGFNSFFKASTISTQPVKVFVSSSSFNLYSSFSLRLLLLLLFFVWYINCLVCNNKKRKTKKRTFHFCS